MFFMHKYSQGAVETVQILFHLHNDIQIGEYLNKRHAGLLLNKFFRA